MRKLLNNRNNVKENLVTIHKAPTKMSDIHTAVLKKYGVVTKANVEKYKKGLDS